MFLAGLFAFGVACYIGLGAMWRRKIDDRRGEDDEK